MNIAVIKIFVESELNILSIFLGEIWRADVRDGILQCCFFCNRLARPPLRFPAPQGLCMDTPSQCGTEGPEGVELADLPHQACVRACKPSCVFDGLVRASQPLGAFGIVRGAVTDA